MKCIIVVGALAAAAGVAASKKGEDITLSQQHANVEALILGDKSLASIMNDAETEMEASEAYAKVGKHVLPDAMLQEVAGKPVKLTDASIKKAIGLLNDMIEGAVGEIDKLTITCKAFHARNRARYNAIMSDLGRVGADMAREVEVMGSSATCIDEQSAAIKLMETKINAETGEYKRLRAIDDAEMTVRKNDLAVGEFIMQVTKCKAKGGPMGLMEMQSCQADGAEGVVEDESIIEFLDPEVQAKLAGLIHKDSKSLMNRALEASFVNSVARGAGLISTMSAVHVSKYSQTPQTTTNNPPPRGKQANKCSRGKVNCGLLHDNMSLMWGEMKDAVDELQDAMDTKEKIFNELMADLNGQLKGMTDGKAKCTSELAAATGKRNQLVEEQGDLQTEKGEVNKEFKKVWGDCKAQIYELTYTKMCGARIVRGDVASKGTKFKPTDIIDCEVTEFVPGKCSQPCDKKKTGIAKAGRTHLTREIVQKNNKYGTECPKLSYPTDCNAFLCPIDCKHSAWSGFGKCSKECEGGTKMRTRTVVRVPMNGGKWCEDTVHSVACNTMSCDRNCRLHRWTRFTMCSQACDGGFRERFRKIRVPTRGRGYCFKKMSRVRYHKGRCNTHRCVGDEKCIAKVDVVLAIDGSGSLRSTGFEMLKNFTGELAKNFVGRKYKRMAMKVGVIQFGNGEIQDDGTIAPAKIMQPLTHKMPLVKKAIKKTKWQMGFTNMAQAFTMAENLFRDGGRKDAQSQIVVITDGKPSFKFQTMQAVTALRDANVHVNIVAAHPHKGSKEVKLMSKWASNPPESHMIHIPGLTTLVSNAKKYVTKTLVQFCPRAMSPSMEKKKNKRRGYKLVVEKRDCLGWWWRIWKACPNRRCRNLADCGAAARKVGAKYFVYYGYRGRSYCYAHKKNDGKCRFKKRPWMRKKGWTKSVFSVYGLEGLKGADGAKKSLLAELNANGTADSYKTEDEVPEETRPSEDDGDKAVLAEADEQDAEELENEGNESEEMESEDLSVDEIENGETEEDGADEEAEDADVANDDKDEDF